MIDINLVSQKLTESTIKVNFNPSTEENLELNVTSLFNMKYSDDNTHCIGTLEQRVTSKEKPEQISIYIKIDGLFDCKEPLDDESRKEIHVECYYRLFPYAQSLIAQIFVAAGLPPLMIKPQKMLADDVNISHK